MNKIILCCLASFMLFGACKQDYIGQYPVDHEPPGAVSSVSVKNIPGGSIISYAIPADEDFSYVEALYTIDGKSKEQKSSAFKQDILVEGFGRSEEQQIKLIAFDKSGNASAPVEVKIHPLDAPVFSIIETVTVDNDFGGIRIGWENPDTADIVLTVLTTSNQYGVQEWTEADRFYSGGTVGQVNVRGYKDSVRYFGLYFRDHWNNLSDTLYFKSYPLYEVELDKSKFRRWNPPGIPYNAYTNNDWRIENLWNGNISKGFASYTHDNTFDMGQKAILSRLKINNRPEASLLYNFAHPKKFQIWGSDNPNVNADFSTWILLGEFESYKPSGLPLGQLSEDDYNYGYLNGEEWNFPSDIPPVRYIRWYVIDTWGGSTYTQVEEITFWGNVID